MRTYKEHSQKQAEVKCNQCGREIPVKGTILQEDILSVEKDWGYFSEKDGMKHKWDLCEECYNKLIQGFVIPVEAIDRTEMI